MRGLAQTPPCGVCDVPPADEQAVQLLPDFFQALDEVTTEAGEKKTGVRR
jgi:hypothetical protein